MLNKGMDTPNILRDILTRLDAVRRREQSAAAVRGALITAFVLLAVFLTALAIEEVFHLGVVLRAVLTWGILVLAVGLLVRLVLLPVLRRSGILPSGTDEATAARVGSAFPQVRDRLVNLLQLSRERTWMRYYSAELIDASFEDLRRDIEPLDFSSIINFAGSRRAGRLLGVAIGIAILLFVLFPTPFFGSAYRLWHYDQTFAAPAPFSLVVEPGNREVVKGGNVTVVVRVEGAQPQGIVLASRPEEQIAFEEQKLQPLSPGVYTHAFAGLRVSTVYYAYAGDVRSDQFTLRVVDRPMVKLLRVHLDYPRYAKLPARQLDDNVGDVTALKGTVVSFSIESNKTLSGACIVFSDSAFDRLQTDGGRASGRTVLSRERSYHLILTDAAGTSSVDPVEYAMKIVPDAYPTVSILVPGTDLDVAGNAGLAMVFRISDDYGFSRLRLASKLVQSRYEKPPEQFSFVDVPLPTAVGTEGTVSYTWPVEELRLVPEDVISYYAEVFDNDNVSGPKSAVSEMFSIRMPSLQEVFKDVDEGHQASLETMQKALKDAQDARKNLDDLQHDLKKNQQKMDWQDKKKAEDLVRKYQEIQKSMDEVRNTVDRMMEEMQKNQVLSKETLDKYQELQHLLEELSTPEFREAMKKLEDAMSQMNPEALKQAMQQFNFTEENFRKSIERTMNLLKRVQIEQKVDEAVKRAEALEKKQTELREETAKTSPADSASLNTLAREQKDLKKDLGDLQQQLAELQKKMEEFSQEMPLSEMEKIADSLQNSRLPEQMDQIAQQMEQQQTEGAMQNQQAAARTMASLMQQLQQMKKDMLQNQQQKIAGEMRRTEQDLLDLSKRQEDLKNESQALDQNSRRFRELSESQMDVMNDLGNLANRLSGLSQKTFGVTPEMGKSIGDAMRKMDGAMQSLDQRSGSSASQQQSGAMASLNEAAQMVADALNAMMQGGGQGLGMAGFMQRLQQMSMTQQKINQGTREGGGLTQEEAARMGRLAGEQGMVRKSLEELHKEAAAAGQLSKILGDLNSIAQEMREVQTDLAQGNVNPGTLQKEDRILSRLLDSQKSMQERDFEKRRKSESGTTVARTGPGAVDLSKQEDKNRLRRDLLKALEEGYSRDYQELIKQYFESLEQGENVNQ